MDSLTLPPSERHLIDQQRLKLAAAQTTDPGAQAAIAESFVAGYRVVLWIAVGMALASALSAFVLIDRKKALRVNPVARSG